MRASYNSFYSKHESFVERSIIEFTPSDNLPRSIMTTGFIGMVCLCFSLVIMLVLSFTQPGKFNRWVAFVLLAKAVYFFWVQQFGRKISSTRELGNESRGTLFQAGVGYLGSITLSVASLVLSLTLFYNKYLQFNIIMANGERTEETFTKSYTRIKLLYNWAAIGVGVGAILFGISTYLFWKLLERNKLNLERALMNFAISLSILFASFALSRVMEVSQQEAVHPAMRPLFSSGEMSFNALCLFILVLILGFALFANAASSKMLYFLAGLLLLIICLTFAIKTAHSLRFVRQSVAPGEKATRSAVRGLSLLHEADVEGDCRKYLPDGAGCEKSLLAIYWEGDQRTRSLDPACARAARVSLLYSVFVAGVFALLAYGFTAIVIYCAFFLWSDPDAALIPRGYSIRAPEVQELATASTQTGNQFTNWCLLSSAVLLLVAIFLYFYGPSVNPLKQSPNGNVGADFDGLVRKDDRFPLVPAEFVAKVNTSPASPKFGPEPTRLFGNLFVKSRDGKLQPVQPALGQYLRMEFWINGKAEASLAPLSMALAGTFAFAVPIPAVMSPAVTGTLVTTDTRGYFAPLHLDVPLTSSSVDQLSLPDQVLVLPSGTGCEDAPGAVGGGYEASVECQSAQGLVGPRMGKLRILVADASGEGNGAVAGARVSVYRGVYVVSQEGSGSNGGDGRPAIVEGTVGQDAGAELEVRGAGVFTVIVRKAGYIHGRAVISWDGSETIRPITLWLIQVAKSPSVMNIRLRVDNKYLSDSYNLAMAFKSTKGVDCKLSAFNKYCGYSSFDDQLAADGNSNLQAISLWGLSASNYVIYIQKVPEGNQQSAKDRCKPWKLANTRILAFQAGQSTLQAQTLAGRHIQLSGPRMLSANTDQNTFFLDIDEHRLSKLDTNYLIVGCFTGFGPLSIKYTWTPSATEPTPSVCTRPQSDQLSLESLQTQLSAKST